MSSNDMVIARWITTTSMTATGNLVLVIAPLPGASLELWGYNITFATVTTNMFETGFRGGLAGRRHFRHRMNTANARFQSEFTFPWLMGTSTALVIAATQTGAQPSIPTILVTVYGATQRRDG